MKRYQVIKFNGQWGVFCNASQRYMSFHPTKKIAIQFKNAYIESGR